jgi:hypothetical protein
VPKEHLDYRGLISFACHARQVQRRKTFGVARVYLSAVIEQKPGYFHAAFLHCHVQRRPVFEFRALVHGAAVRDQRFNFGHIASAHGSV